MEYEMVTVKMTRRMARKACFYTYVRQVDALSYLDSALLVAVTAGEEVMDGIAYWVEEYIAAVRIGIVMLDASL